MDCPTCGDPGLPIVYGLPGPELMAAGERGEVLFGGCVIGEEMPHRGCRNGHEWSEPVSPASPAGRTPRR